MRFYLLLFFCLTYVSLYTQNTTENFEKYHNGFHEEKLYIATDRDYYFPSDTVWFKVYYRNGRTHERLEAEPLVYLDYLNSEGEKLKRVNLKVENGAAIGDLILPEDAVSGLHSLRAFTQYQLNFDHSYLSSKSILVLNNESKKTENKDIPANIKIFPEGGDLIEGIETKVAFYCTDKNGFAKDITASLYNANGEKVLDFSSMNNGRGYFNWQPTLGDFYIKADVDGNEIWANLPKIKPSGFVIQADMQKKGFVNLTAQSSTGLSLENCTLLGHLRGQLFLEQTLDTGNTQSLLIPLNDLPSGVLHFTLLDEQRLPRSERLVFNDAGLDSSQYSLKLSKDVADLRDLLSLEIEQLKPKLEGDFNLSVYYDGINYINPQRQSITSYLLMESELDGRATGYLSLFEDMGSRKSRILRDLIMMTHYWRKFEWDDIVKGATKGIQLPTQDKFNLAGRALHKRKKKPIKADVQISILDKDKFVSVNQVTDENGMFVFSGFELKDTTEMIFVASEYDEKKKKKQKAGEGKSIGKKNVKLEFIDIYDDLLEPIQKTNANLTKLVDQEAFEMQDREEIAREAFADQWSIDLDAFTVKTTRESETQMLKKKTRQIYRDMGVPPLTNSQQVLVDDLAITGAGFTDIYDLIRVYVPGASIRVDPSTYVKRVQFRGIASITQEVYAGIMLNGSFISDQSARTIDPSNVYLIDVTRGLQGGAALGEAAAGGVISIITKDYVNSTGDVSIREKKNSIILKHPGIYQARRIYSPTIEDQRKSPNVPDLRKTLMWEPFVDPSIDADFQIMTGDLSGKYMIQLEGILDDGTPVFEQRSFEVKLD